MSSGSALLSSRSWLEERFLSPVVVASASDEADLVASYNGLDMVQLLRPFATYTENLYARVGDKNEMTVVRQFGVRLLRPECLREMDPRTRGEHFQWMMREVAPSELAFGEQLDLALDAVVSQRVAGGSLIEPKLDRDLASILLQRCCPAWHHQFVSDYLSMVRCSYFDALDHPVANLLVTATNREASVMLDQLREQERRAKACRDGMPCMDDELLTFVIVVHDHCNGPPFEHVVHAFAAVQNHYTAQRCMLLRLNGVVNTTEQQQRPLDCSRWVQCNPPVESLSTNGSGKKFGTVKFSFGAWPDTKRPKITGCCLSPANLDDIQHVMNQFMAMALFPHLERKLRSLAASINEKRQSTISKVVGWFKSSSGGSDGKAKTECWVVSTDGSPPKYLASSLEMQMRRAGDLCLAMKDYDSAANYFRMCRQELQSTLSSREFNRFMIAACQEGVAICQYFQGRLALPQCGKSSSGPECRMETARDEYQKNSVHSYAFRASLLLYSICRSKTPPQNNLAMQVLQQVLRAGAVSANKIYAAVIYELCAMTCLFVNPPLPMLFYGEAPAAMPDDFPVRCRLREFARCMAIAGSAYLEIGQLEMSLRCYLRAHRVCRAPGVCGRGSRLVMHEHLQTLIAHLCNKLNAPARAIGFTTAAVCDGVPAYSSVVTGGRNVQSFFRRIKALLEEHGLTEAPWMPLPVLRFEPGTFGIQTTRCHADEITIHEELQCAGDAAEREWKVLEDGLRAHYHERTSFTVAKHYADGGPGRRGCGYSGGITSTSIPVGERATMYYTLSNPTALPLAVKKLSLLVVTPSARASALPAAEESASGGAPSSSAAVDQQQKFSVRDAIRVPVCSTGGDREHDSVAASSLDVVLVPPLTETRVWLPMTITEEGEHVVIGLSWSTEEVEGFVLFSSVGMPASSSSGSSSNSKGTQLTSKAFSNNNNNSSNIGELVEQLYSATTSAAEQQQQPQQVLLQDKSHLVIHGVSRQANIELSYDPPMPTAMRDGQMYIGALCLANKSDSVAASHITIQRSPANAHLTFFPSLSPLGSSTSTAAGAEAAMKALSGGTDESTERPMALSEPLPPGGVLRVPVIYRAQHSGRSSRCFNNLPFLVGYLPSSGRSPTSFGNNQNGGGQNGNPLNDGISSSSTPGVLATPVSPAASTATTTATGASPLTASPFSQHVRTARILRRIVVRATLAVEHEVVATASKSETEPQQAPGSGEGPVLVTVVTHASPQRGDNALLLCRITAVTTRSTRLCPRLLSSPAYDLASGAGADGVNPLLLAPDHGAVALAIRLESSGNGKALSSSETPTRNVSPMPATETNSNSSSQSPLLVDHCLVSPLSVFQKKALSGRIDAFGACFGCQGIADDSASLHFATTSVVGSGSLGEYVQRDAGDFSFYLDKAGGKTPQQLEDERLLQDEVRKYGQPVSQCPPLCIAVAWCDVVESQCGPTTVFGQHFSFLDVCRKMVARQSGVGANAAPRANTAADLAVRDDSLVAAFRRLRSVEPTRGVLVYTATAIIRQDSHTLSATKKPSPCYYCDAEVVVTFRSWCGLPLRVEVNAQPLFQRVPCVTHTYVGNTKRRFLLLPFESRSVPFVARCFQSGTLNVNSVEVNAVASSSVSLAASSSTSSATPPHDSAALQRVSQRLVVIGSETPWLLRATVEGAALESTDPNAMKAHFISESAHGTPGSASTPVSRTPPAQPLSLQQQPPPPPRQTTPSSAAAGTPPLSGSSTVRRSRGTSLTGGGSIRKSRGSLVRHVNPSVVHPLEFSASGNAAEGAPLSTTTNAALAESATAPQSPSKTASGGDLRNSSSAPVAAGDATTTSDVAAAMQPDGEDVEPWSPVARMPPTTIAVLHEQFPQDVGRDVESAEAIEPLALAVLGSDEGIQSNTEPEQSSTNVSVTATGEAAAASAVVSRRRSESSASDGVGAAVGVGQPAAAPTTRRAVSNTSLPNLSNTSFTVPDVSESLASGVLQPPSGNMDSSSSSSSGQENDAMDEDGDESSELAARANVAAVRSAADAARRRAAGEVTEAPSSPMGDTLASDSNMHASF